VDALKSAQKVELVRHFPKIVTLFDPAHMIKLVRNAFDEKKVFRYSKNIEIKFEYVR